MNQVEAVRRALLELGDVSHQELAAFIGTNYGVMVKPQVVPILKATIKDKENLTEWRRKTQAVQARSTTPVEDQSQAA